MQALARFFLYLITGIVPGAALACLIALALGADAVTYSEVGAGIGALAGLVFGIIRRFQ